MVASRYLPDHGAPSELFDITHNVRNKETPLSPWPARAAMRWPHGSDNFAFEHGAILADSAVGRIDLHQDSLK